METVPGGISMTSVMRFIDIAVDALGETREEIDALNVYPVPDGDTGTNMYLTVSSAREAAREALADAEAQGRGEDLAPVLAAFARGALLGARGNSGVILSQILTGVVQRLAAAVAEPTRPSGPVMAEAFAQAADAAYAAVGTPVEGTILTVARAAADAALTRAGVGQARVRDIFTASARAAREALARTPEQLAVLRNAGVVDAGGRGLSVILDAAEQAATGRAPQVPVHKPRLPVPIPAGDLTAEGPAYEVMYLLDATDAAVQTMRGRLADLGDSLVVVGGEGLWNVHVHVDDVGAAIEAGIEAGRPHRVRVTHFAEQLAELTGTTSTPTARPGARTRTGRAVVAVAAGPGLEQLFAEAGAVVVPGGPARRPSTGELLSAVDASGAAEVVLLPNDPDTVRVAQIAARTAEEDWGTRVRVIPSLAQVQGLAAVAVHDPGRAFDSDVLEMTATAVAVRHGAVTVAAKQAMTMAGPCEVGDVLGVVAGDFAVVGGDLEEVTHDVLGRLLAGGGELVTLVGGAGVPEGLLERTTSWVESAHPHVDVLVYTGGQDRYPLLMSVE